MCRKQACYTRTMSNACIVSTCMDGARFGDPPEETYLQVCDNMDTEVTTIAIPQVPSN